MNALECHTQIAARNAHNAIAIKKKTLGGKTEDLSRVSIENHIYNILSVSHSARRTIENVMQH